MSENGAQNPVMFWTQFHKIVLILHSQNGT